MEVINDETGAANIVAPQSVDPSELNFKGPFVTEEIDETHYVSADRIVYKSIYSRLVRATEDGFQRFPWGFAETPADLRVRKIQLGVRSPDAIGRIVQMGHISYAIDFMLAHPLLSGETHRLSFYKIIDALGYCDRFIGGSSTVELKKVRIAVIFDSGLDPDRVWWNAKPHTIYPTWHIYRRASPY